MGKKKLDGRRDARRRNGGTEREEREKKRKGVQLRRRCSGNLVEIFQTSSTAG